MKIERICLRNLTSIAGEQTIDFTREPLRSAGLFAITGDTGTGKSTILDAICLALYNRAPRFDGVETIRKDELAVAEGTDAKLPPTDPRGILRRGCKEGGCDVVFSMPDGSRYEASWNLRVKRTGNYDRVQRGLRCLSPRKETVPEAEISQRIVDVLGLDYAQFTRTVILAQNSFANFLRASRTDKSNLLEKLTGTEIYGRISVKIHEMAADATRRVADIENVITGILHDRLAPDALAAQQEERTLLTARADALSTRIGLVGRQLQWFADFDAASAELAARETAHAAANKAYMAMRADELSLERYDNVLAVQPLYQEIVMRQGDIAEVKRQEERLTADIDAEHRQIAAATATLDEAHERTAEAENRLALRRPAISRGHVLNGEIGEAEGQLRKADEQLRDARLLHEEREAALSLKKEQLAEAENRLEESQLHAQALAVHRLMFDKFDLVKDKLAALATETHRNGESHKKCAALQKEQADLKASYEKVEKKRQDDEDSMATLKSELLIHRQSNQGHDSARLQQRFADNRNRLIGLQRAEALWARISSGYDELEEKRAAVSRLAATQTQLRRDVAQAERQLDIIEEACKRMNVAYTLSQSESIVGLRKRLKEGTACPVCGATHHPYHTETERELGELITNLEKEYQEAAEECAAKRNALNELRNQLATGDGRLEADRRNLEEREARQAADVEEWKACAALDPSFADCSPTVARDARRLLIGMFIENTRRDADEAEKELETFNFHQGHINQLNERISRLEAQMADDRTRITDLRTQYKISSAAAEESERVMSLSDRSCGELYADLGSMVTLSGWFTEWKNNPDGFRMRLSALYSDWQQTTKDVDTLQRSTMLLREELKTAENTLAQVVRYETQALEARDAIAETLAGKRDELKHLFGDGDAEKEEHELQTAIERAREEEKKVRQAHGEATSRLSLMQGELQSLVQNRLRRQEEYSAKMSELDLWILRFNATNSPMQFAELKAIFADKRDWKALRTRLDTLKEELTLATNRLQAARDALMKLRNRPDQPTGEGDESRESLETASAALKQEHTQLSERLTEVNLRLLSHERSVEQAAAYEERLTSARADAEEWKRLDALLGSADGKKFRELAQSHTFAYLVACANRQLRLFSPRYELCNVPGTLNLEIIDRDMFDEHRYVSSLSGGETFVVSLALALGLAALSGTNLAIGSLFIDEGFGNLDHASLDLVMSALSNLENAQGRKVGVISHTDQIRSQISPQVRLVRQPGSGSSRIEIC